MRQTVVAPHNRDLPFHAGYGLRQSLRELMDHRKLDITRGYYVNSRELHQTGEKSQVA